MRERLARQVEQQSPGTEDDALGGRVRVPEVDQLRDKRRDLRNTETA